MEETLTRQQAFMAIQIIDKMLRSTVAKMAREDDAAVIHIGHASASLHYAMDELNNESRDGEL